ncbi:MAG: potassium transporter Kup [Verrucomicrobiales bacterium]|nr:potassium transporter Kup [Verrucomicrobiales bacterium]
MKTDTSPSRFLGLSLGALGVVYGDIGTSPLYALRECFHGPAAVAADRRAVLGVLSAVIWSLILIVCVKYLSVVTRANNRGEGGILALLALVLSRLGAGATRLPLMILGACGTALLLGEGMITPAITVLGAVEGLQVAAPRLAPLVVPVTVAILVGLFAVQRIGTGGIGRLFGPVTLVWFLTLAALGLRGIVHDPGVLAAFDPSHAIGFLGQEGGRALFVLGAVFLTLTGVEALYADMGHFGAGPIRCAWFVVVFPALLLNYLGQGAWLLSHPGPVENPFFDLAPSWALYPLTGLATAAAVIASQALIAGAFSMARQAMQLGFLPRLTIQHTSSTERGQIYVGAVNWLLMVACIGLVLGFRTSRNLASAYGIGVSLTLMMTTLLLFVATQRVRNWSPWRSILVCGSFLAAETVFLVANFSKFGSGGWFPITMGALVYLVMATWFRGRAAVQKELVAGSLPLGMFLAEIERKSPARVPGTAVFLTANPESTPGALLHNLKHNKILHERVIILRFAVSDAPYVDAEDRLQIEELTLGFYRVAAFFGFMESPTLDTILELCANKGVPLDPMRTTYFLGRETILATHKPGMARWRKHLFSLLSRNAQQATAYFRLPPNRVVELGMQVEI